MEKQPCAYLLASKRYGTLYTGVTSSLLKGSIWEHKTHSVDGFTKKYDVTALVWYEVHESMESASKRENHSRTGTEPGKYGLLKK